MLYDDSVRTDGAVSRGHASEPKGREFESHSCHLVRTYGRRFVQVRPVRPKIHHFKKNSANLKHNDLCNLTIHTLL